MKNIDDADYEQLYRSVDRDPVIQAYQQIKLRTILPVLRFVRPGESLLDVGCARGNMLGIFLRHGLTDVSGMDLEDRRDESLRPSTAFYRASICDPEFEPGRRFDNLFVHCMLHHVPAAELPLAAANIPRLLNPGGRVFIYDTNLVSPAGRIFYNWFLRLWPGLYRSTTDERDDQLAFCAAWPAFADALTRRGIRVIRRSEWSFYKVFVGVRG